MNIHQRIKRRRIELDMTREQLAAECGVTHQTIGNWETDDEQGGSAPRRGRLALVARVLKVSQTWLLTGISDNVKAGEIDKKYVFIPPYRSPFPETPRVKRHHEIRHLNDEHDSYAYRIDWMQRHGLEPHACVVVEATDSAMQLGDQCLVDTSQKKIVAGQPYALDGKGGVRLRRLFTRLDGQITLRADNPAFPEEVAAPDALVIIGRVVAFSGAVPPA